MTGTKVLEKVREKVEGVKLEAAPITVSGDRGIGGSKVFNNGDWKKVLPTFTEKVKELLAK